MDSESSLGELFALLSRWRKYPNYQLERRADIFFALYLSPILRANQDGFELDLLIPEFPIRKGALSEAWQDDPNLQNRSIKVDYLCFDKTRQRCILLELKTDESSIRQDQVEAMVSLKNKPIGPLLTDLGILRDHSKQASKYQALVNDLLAQRVITMDEQGAVHPSGAIANLEPELVLIKPTLKGSEKLTAFSLIDFDGVRQALKPIAESDPLAAQFQQALADWSV